MQPAGPAEAAGCRECLAPPLFDTAVLAGPGRPAPPPSPWLQQEAVLQRVRGQENVILLGDFNFRPDTEQYRLTTALLDDPWLLRRLEGNPDQGVDPARTIDHIFAPPGIRVVDSTYLPGPHSDHPALVTAIEW